MIALLLALALQATPPAAPAIAPPPAPLAAIEPERLAAAVRLVELLKIEVTLDAMFVQLSPNFAQSVLGVMATDVRTKAAIDKLVSAAPANRDRMIAILAQEFLASVKQRYPLFRQQIAQEYAAAFTRGELDAIAAFYSSGPGAKALTIMPQLQAKLSVAGQAIGRAAGEEAGSRAFKRIEEEMLPDTRKPAA